MGEILIIELAYILEILSQIFYKYSWYSTDLSIYYLYITSCYDEVKYLDHLPYIQKTRDR